MPGKRSPPNSPPADSANWVSGPRRLDISVITSVNWLSWCRELGEARRAQRLGEPGEAGRDRHRRTAHHLHHLVGRLHGPRHLGNRRLDRLLDLGEQHVDPLGGLVEVLHGAVEVLDPAEELVDALAELVERADRAGQRCGEQVDHRRRTGRNDRHLSSAQPTSRRLGRRTDRYTDTITARPWSPRRSADTQRPESHRRSRLDRRRSTASTAPSESPTRNPVVPWSMISAIEPRSIGDDGRPARHAPRRR